MAKLQNILIVVTLGLVCCLLLFTSESEAAVAQLGEVKCILFINFDEKSHDIRRECHEKLLKELKEKGKDPERKDHVRYPFNATLEDFEFDDFCHEHCFYKTAGLLSKDDTLPKKTDTASIFGNDNVSDDHYKAITSVWDECLGLSAEIGKKKGWDNCKIVTHHNFCFDKKWEKVMMERQVNC